MLFEWSNPMICKFIINYINTCFYDTNLEQKCLLNSMIDKILTIKCQYLHSLFQFKVRKQKQNKTNRDTLQIAAKKRMRWIEIYLFRKPLHLCYLFHRKELFAWSSFFSQKAPQVNGDWCWRPEKILVYRMNSEKGEIMLRSFLHKLTQIYRNMPTVSQPHAYF